MRSVTVHALEVVGASDSGPACNSILTRSTPSGNASSLGGCFSGSFSTLSSGGDNGLIETILVWQLAAPRLCFQGGISHLGSGAWTLWFLEAAASPPVYPADSCTEGRQVRVPLTH